MDFNDTIRDIIAERDRMRGLLREFAIQLTVAENDGDDLDYEGAYDIFIEKSRETLKGTHDAERDAAPWLLESTKCASPGVASCAKKWEADHQREVLSHHGLADEFPYGCDAIDAVAESLLAAREQLAALEAKLPHYAKGGAFVPGVDEAWDSDGYPCSIIDDFSWDGVGGIISKYTGASLFYPTAAACEEAEGHQ